MLCNPSKNLLPNLEDCFVELILARYYGDEPGQSVIWLAYGNDADNRPLCQFSNLKKIQTTEVSRFTSKTIRGHKRLNIVLKHRGPKMFDPSPRRERPKKLRTQLIESSLLDWITGFPPIAFMIRKAVKKIARRQIHGAPNPEIELRIQSGTRLNATLQGIAYEVVTSLGYIGAMVASYEQGDSPPVRAYYINPKIVSSEKIKEWGTVLSKTIGELDNISDPKIAKAFRYKKNFEDNLSIKSIEAGEPVTSDDLYSLFIPIAHPSSRPMIAGIQEALGIKQVIAVPLILETSGGDRRIVGNILAAKAGEITDQDKLVLLEFGREAAAAIELES